MNKSTITAFSAIAAACFAGTAAYAGPKPTAPPSKPIKEPLAESCITGTLGVDVVSEYIFRGVVLENQGLIIQPFADLHFRLYKGAGPVQSITADVAIWNSFQSHRSGPGGSTTTNWYEFDFYTGLTFEVDKFTISPQFALYTSPADAFQNIYTVGIKVAYDDEELLGKFALNPYVLAELELVESNGNGLRPGGGNANGQYYEVGITPGHSYGDLTLTLPIKAGFGSANYYLGNRGFGFFSVGIDAEYALSTVPECLGKWSVHGGVTYIRLGGSNDVNSPSGAAGSGPAFGGGVVSNENQFVFGGGLKVSF